MARTTTRAGLAAALLWAAALAGPAAAGDLLTRTELKRAPLAGQPGTVVVMTRLEARAGAALPRHTHPGDEINHVLQGGALRLADGTVRRVEAGSTMHFPRGEPHGGFEVVEGPIQVITVHVVDADRPMMQMVD